MTKKDLIENVRANCNL